MFYLLEADKIVNELLKECMKKGFLLDREMLELFNSLDSRRAYEIIDVLGGLSLTERVITKKVFSSNLEKIQNSIFNFSKKDDVESFLIGFGGKGKGELVDKDENDVEKKGSNIKLLNVPSFDQKKVTVNNFVRCYKSRYEFVREILEEHEFEDLSSIRKIGSNSAKYTIIGCVVEKRITKNKNLLLVVEDLTGVINIIVNQNKKTLFEKGNELLLDDIVAFSVSGTKEILFCDEIYFPEAFLSEKKYHSEDVWVAFTGDLHCGSNVFLEKNFLRFVKWLNGEEGDLRYRSIAKKVKYLFIVGDMVDGVNCYPGQEKDLDILTSVGQYAKVEELMKLIRRDVHILMCPGSNDSVWLGEPQAFVGKKWASGLYEIENLHLVSNPATIEIDGGFRVLMYHGASINAFIDEISEIRVKYGHSSPTTVVKEMVKRRHLAPTHGVVDYVPYDIDSMLINTVPDIIVTGNQHVCEVSSKNNILLVASSCWQSSTPFMEKVGINSDPCKVPLFNLKTREVKILDFSSGTKEIEWEKGDNLFCKLEGDMHG